MKVLGFDVTLPRIQRSDLSKRSASDVSDLKDPSAWLMQSLIGAAQNATGITVTPLKAMGVATVFACVRVISDSVSTLPLNVHKREGRASRIAPDHPLYSILHDMPNEEMTSADARWAMQANLSLRSNCYAEILRDIDGDPIGIYPIETTKMDVYRDSLSKQLRYRVIENSSVFKPKDIIHLRSITFNGVTGIDLLGVVREAIALAMALQDNAAKFFGNGSRPSGVLEHPASLSPEAQERLRNQVEAQTGGKNLYRLLVLEEGLKYNALRSENKDSQFDESRLAQDLNICRVFGVPPHKVGIMSGQPRANVEQDNLSFITEVIRPICVRWEQVLNARLLSSTDREQGYFIEHDLDAFARGDMKSRYDSFAVARQWGWMSANDVREKENLPSVEGGDVYLQPLNMADSKSAREIQLSKVNAAPPPA
jgi:HK97 family phage portal protein